jgi:hypothetical protein
MHNQAQALVLFGQVAGWLAYMQAVAAILG